MTKCPRCGEAYTSDLELKLDQSLENVRSEIIEIMKMPFEDFSKDQCLIDKLRELNKTYSTLIKLYD